MEKQNKNMMHNADVGEQNVYTDSDNVYVMAVISFMLGLISMWILSEGLSNVIMLLLCSILGVFFGVKADKQKTTKVGTVGLTLSVVTIVLWCGVLILMIYAGVSVGSGMKDAMEVLEGFF